MLNIGCSDNETEKIQHWSRANQYLKNRQFAEAVIEIQNVIQLDPENDTALCKLGEIYIELGQLKSAYEAFQKAVLVNSDNVKAHIKLGHLFLLAGFIEDAKKEATFVLEESSQDIEALELLSECQIQQNDFNEEIYTLRMRDIEALELLSECQIQQNDFNEAIYTLKMIAAINPNPSKALLTLGRIYLSMGDLDQAEMAILAAVWIDPRLSVMLQSKGTNFRSFPVLARYYENQHQWDLAEQMYQKTVESYPEDKVIPLMELAAFYNRKSDFDKALETAKRALTFKKFDSNILVFIAKTHLDMNQKEQALAIIDDVLKRNNQHIDANYFKGTIDLLNRDYDSALKHFNFVIDKRPKSEIVHYYKALSLLGKGEIKQAQFSAIEAVDLNPKFIDARYILAKIYLKSTFPGNRRLAEEQLEQILELSPNHIEALFLYGDLKIEAKRFKEAEALFTKLIRFKPDSSAAYFKLGKIFKETNREKEAINAYQRSIEIDPPQIDALKILVNIHLNNKDLDSAFNVCTAYEKKFQKSPHDASRIQFLKGKIFQTQGNTDQAVEHYYQSIELDSSYTDPHLALTEMYLKKNQIDRIISYYENILGKAPEFLLAHMQLGFFYNQQGQKGKAEFHYRKAMATKKGFAPAANNLALILLEEGKINEAFDLARLAMDKMPDDPKVSDTMGWAYYLLGYFGEAVAALEKSVSKLPNDPIVNYHLGMAYFRYEDFENAKKYLQRAVQMDLNFPGVVDASETLHFISASME